MIELRKPTRGYLLIAAATIIWGSIGILVRWADLPGQENVIVFWRMLIGACFYLFTITASRKSTQLRLGQHHLMLPLSGALLSFHWILMFKAINRLTVSDAVFIAYLAPVFTALLAPLILKEKLEKTTPVALLLALSGVALTSLTQRSESSLDAVGIIYALAGALTYATLVLMLKVMREDTPALTITFYQSLFGGLVLVPFTLFQSYSIKPQGWISIIILGVIHIGIAGLLYVHAARQVKAQHIGIISYLEPLSAMVFGLLFLGERPGWQDLAGGLLIIAAGLTIFLQITTGEGKEAKENVRKFHPNNSS